MINKKFSIIVPVYNAEKYIKKCIDTLINQTYKNIEIILINDGSTDLSFEICNQYARKDERIILINQENKGVSYTRNRAINISTGEYIIFVDSDDYCELNMLEEISKNLNSYDIICFGFSKVFKSNNETLIDTKPPISVNELKTKIFNDDNFRGFLWNKVFSSNIIKKNNIAFNEKIHFCEDLVFINEYMNYVKSSLYIAKSLYNYRMRKNSVTYNFFNSKNVSILIAYDFLIQRTEDASIKNMLEFEYLLYYYK